MVILIGGSRLLAALHLDWIGLMESKLLLGWAGLGWAGLGGHEVFGCKCIIICTDPHSALGPALGSGVPTTDIRIQEKVEAG